MEFYLACFILLIVCLISARIPVSYLLVRSIVVIPFAGFAALSYMLTRSGGTIYWQSGTFAVTSEGLISAGLLMLRSWLAVSCMIVLVNTTTFDLILKAFRTFRLPPVLIMLLSFFYRYLYLIWDESERMQRARNLRYFGGKLNRQYSMIGNLVSSLFIRTYERTERVQMTMLSRGWDGSAAHMTLKPFEQRNVLNLVTAILILILLIWTSTW